jgi:hypothetical protein
VSYCAKACVALRQQCHEQCPWVIRQPPIVASLPFHMLESAGGDSIALATHGTLLKKDVK